MNSTKLSKISCPDPRLLQEVGDLAPAYLSAIRLMDKQKIITPEKLLTLE